MRLDIFLKKVRIRLNKLFTRTNWDILIELIRADFKVSDRNSILGFLWALISPITLLIIMYLIFKMHFGIRIYAYPLYLLIGIVSVSFFITSTTYLTKALFTNRDLVINSMVTRESIILSDLVIHLSKFLIEILFCLILSIFYNLFIWKFFLLLLPLVISYAGFSLGVSLVLSLCYCFAKDIEHIWMVATRILFFATPIFYGLDSLSPFTRNLIYWFNPLTPFLSSFRGIVMGNGTIDIFSYGYSIALGILSFILGYSIFIMLEDIAVERV